MPFTAASFRGAATGTFLCLGDHGGKRKMFRQFAEMLKREFKGYNGKKFGKDVLAATSALNARTEYHSRNISGNDVVEHLTCGRLINRQRL